MPLSRQDHRKPAFDYLMPEGRKSRVPENGEPYLLEEADVLLWGNLWTFLSGPAAARRRFFLAGVPQEFFQPPARCRKTAIRKL
jgi:hypothetical protein